jgi:sugar transferase (PEP-CTERM/EpsH1 system associated)
MKPLIAHVVHSFDYGGLENGLVNILNRLPEDLADHVVISLSKETDFRHRVIAKNVRTIALNNPPGQTAKFFPKLYKLFRTLRPTMVHTRNVATLEVQIPAFLARVPIRIHGEHGWDVKDPDGSSNRFRLLRRSIRPLIHHQIALSKQIEDYLIRQVGVDPKRLTRICNGVDVTKFNPQSELSRAQLLAQLGLSWPTDSLIVGTVGRAKEIKNQQLLCESFVKLRKQDSEFLRRGRLIIAGGGPLTTQMQAYLDSEGCREVSWLPGSRDDVSTILRVIDLFVLPSLAEGISNSILEALASGKPVLASRVGGNAELIDDEITGILINGFDPARYVNGIRRVLLHNPTLNGMSLAARKSAVEKFSLENMVGAYEGVYRTLLSQRIRN